MLAEPLVTSEDASYVAMTDDNGDKKKTCMNVDNRMCNLDDNDAPYKNKVAGKGQRMLTDPFCLLLLIVMIVIDIVIYNYAIGEDSNVEWLHRGHDWEGDICYKTGWVNLTYTDITICTDNCSRIDGYVAQEFEDHWCVPNTTIYKKTLVFFFLKKRTKLFLVFL